MYVPYLIPVNIQTQKAMYATIMNLLLVLSSMDVIYYTIMF